MRTLRSPAILIGLAIVASLGVVAVLAPVLAPYDPLAIGGGSLQRPSAQHLLGTNDVGQDILSQIIWGTRASLIVAVGAATVAVVMGVLVGAGAGLIGGTVDVVAMRLVDLFLAVPVLPLLVVIAALAGPSRLNVLLVIGMLTWPPTARLMRSQTLSLRQRGFVHVARGFGAGPLYVIRRHLVPALGSLIVASFLNVAAVGVLLEAGLSFLGLADPTDVSWGLLMNRALRHQGLYFSPLWTWWVLPAGFAISLAVFGFTFLGVGLEPRFNPRWGRAR
jgi:ABC-type dipeptide/oligopeptide/nickel transport system permease subunit